MNKRIYLFFALIVVSLLAACRQSAASTAPPVNTKATIDAAIAATENAKVAMQAQIDAAVNATATANALAVPTPTATPVVVTATPAPTTTPSVAPTAIPEDTVATMTEDELAALIDEAVAEAYASSETYSDAANAATADGTVTQEEVQSADAYYVDAEAAIEYADELLQLYDDLYGDLAYDAIDELDQIDQDLQALTDAVLQLNDTMTQIEALIEDGTTITADDLDDLVATAQLISEYAAEYPVDYQAWQTAYQTAQENRINTVTAIPPTEIAAEPAAALQQVVQFSQTGQAAMEDYHLTADELNALAQQGANAAASLNATNIPQSQELSGMIDDVTRQLAYGDLSQAQAGIAQLSSAMGALQNLPALQGVTVPAVPDVSIPVPSSGMPAIPHRKK